MGVSLILGIHQLSIISPNPGPPGEKIAPSKKPFIITSMTGDP